ncbi:GPI mannosyltransferase 2 [Pyrenophora tritici-repentis]|nr:GPI mannosyltransferase 2 [Pyrenophora tritici-repentis]
MKLPGFSRSGETKQLVIVSCIWKALLLVLAAFCPGPGYDTSALVLLDSSPQRHSNFNALTRHERFVLNLLRWDAFYFVKSAERGHVHEQAWAFSWAYSHLLRLAGQLTAGNAQPSLHYYVLAGIVASNVCHLLSVLVLYRLLTLVLEPQRRQIIPFIAAVLHILTPASLFLCAPYAEAMFSFLNFTGMLFYAQSRTMAETGKSSFGEDLLKISSGLFFAVATLMRSNGLLSGTIFLYDVARNVGLFRYWTVSNLPLFILAAPVMWLLLVSSATILRSAVQSPLHGRLAPQASATSNPRNEISTICKMPELALPQLLLAITAVTSFHIQIVNRIASGYPMWYLVIAQWLVDSQSTGRTEKPSPKAQWIIRGFIVYSLVQGMLYANFLPPA